MAVRDDGAHRLHRVDVKAAGLAISPTGVVRIQLSGRGAGMDMHSIQDHRIGSPAILMKGSAMAERPDIRLTSDEQAAFLREHRKCALATIDRDGFPHIVAMNFLMREGACYMTSYGKAQKVVNIRRDPRVGVMVETGSAYAELKGVMMRGHCEIIEAPDAVNQVFAWMAEARGEPRPQGGSRGAPKRVVLKIVPSKTVTWDHQKLGGRY
jgi:PPOX class probable F420-dependent enzyme